MGNLTPISRRPVRCSMRTAWVHSGALRAPLCIQGDVMAHSAGRREIGVKFSMRAASVDPRSTQHTPDYTVVRKFEVNFFWLSLGFYCEVDVLEGCKKQRKNARWHARFARASADFSKVLCSPPEHRLQNKNRDFKKQTIDFKKTPRPTVSLTAAARSALSIPAKLKP